ncbi:MAG TPA: hypothetical protein VFR90_08490 [Methylibium sp.]|uniref:hypothetical protein n=1 Tax=Methylibium sp. TaxID=2067992 RepID=UPI002DBA66D2|nr:hypothetical protein [Methylibium sp.]HEU4459144.1 hypothetical protein [Methylibium sp.]
MRKNTRTVVRDQTIETTPRVLPRTEGGGRFEPVEGLAGPAAHAHSAGLRRDAGGRREGTARQTARPAGGTATTGPSAFP